MIRIGYVPISFGQSYTVHIVKSSCNVYGKVVTVDDFFVAYLLVQSFLKSSNTAYLIVTEPFLKRVTTSSDFKNT